MQIYLPIAEISLNVFLLLGIGGAVGFLSGMFGVGGGFLLTPILIFIGVPPAIAVATQANQVVGSSVSGVLAQDRKSTRLNSSHVRISYAVFCLKKKKKHKDPFYFRKKKKKKQQ